MKKHKHIWADWYVSYHGTGFRRVCKGRSCVAYQDGKIMPVRRKARGS